MTTITRQDGPDLLDLLAEQAPAAPMVRRGRRHASDARRDEAAAARAAWARRFERVAWTWQHDGPDYRRGDLTLGWRCPDPECGRVVPTSFLLSLNHGWDPECAAASRPWGSGCTRVQLLASQQRAHERYCPAGCGCDELAAASARHDAETYWPSLGLTPPTDYEQEDGRGV